MINYKNLIKPFEPKGLVARVANLIELRRKLRERFVKTFTLKLGAAAIDSMDEAFFKKIIASVEENLIDEHFHIEKLCTVVGMSRVQLHRKISALTVHAPWDFIRFICLRRAMELLQKNAGAVSEIAYMVCFNDPSYFGKSFQKLFGKSPMDVKRTAGPKPQLIRGFLVVSTPYLSFRADSLPMYREGIPFTCGLAPR